MLTKDCGLWWCGCSAHIAKSRYDSIDSFLGTGGRFKREYDDLELVLDEDIYEKLLSEGRVVLALIAVPCGGR